MKNTEQKLKKLFDFQKFEQNQKLSKMINEAESEGVLLSDEELAQVNAAGTEHPALDFEVSRTNKCGS